MGHLLGIDVGTSATKALVLAPDGRVAGSAGVPYEVDAPRPGWSEQGPALWWEAAKKAVRKALRRARVRSRQVTAVGLTGQMHGAVFLDGRDRVLRPCILWNDQRTADECAEMEERVGRQRLVRIALNPALTGFTAPKILWLRNHEPRRFERLRRVLLPKDYLRLLMTGEYATEVSDASGTLLFDVKRRRWSGEILERLELDGALLPPVVESPEVTGRLREEAARELGLAPGTPVVGGAGDCAAAAVGGGVVEPGVVLSSIGTSGVVFAHTDTPLADPAGRVHTFCHAVPGAWHVMGVVLSAGGSLKWFRDRFCAEERAEARRRGCDPYEIITAAAGEVPPGAEGLLFLPCLTGERTPYADPAARGAFVGLTPRHTKAHLARAVMEGVVLAMRDSCDIIRALGVPVRRVVATGGGARSGLWLQLQADVYGRTVSVPETSEGPALGAALLAGVGAGAWGSVAEACRQAVRTASRTRPRPRNVRLYRLLHAEYARLYPALRGSFRALAGFSQAAGFSRAGGAAEAPA